MNDNSYSLAGWLSLVKRDDIAPICPYCKREIKSVAFSEMTGDLGKRFIYFCTDCKAVIGVSHRKGLTFGI
ncbi:MAG: hypothetical protein P1R58_09785 [bacterium]|nr:hypothetical protein [bacterium]